MPRPTKTTKTSTGAMENVQEESSAWNTQKSFSNHLRHMLSQPCSFPTKKVLRWIEQWMMVYTIDSLNGAWSVRTFMSVSLPCYQKKAMQEDSCLKWWFWYGLICFMELVQVRANTWYHLGKIWRDLQAPILWSEGQIWLAYKHLERKQVSWWMKQCSTD